MYQDGEDQVGRDGGIGGVRSREIEHLGSAYDDAEPDALKAAARQRMAAAHLESGLDGGARQ